MEKDRKKLSVHTIGCRLNQYETEKMAAELYPFGFTRAEDGEPADLYIINTCTVTHRADSSSRNIISRAIRENPEASIVVAGCYVDAAPDLMTDWEGVDVVIPNAQKSEIGKILPDRLPDLFTNTDADDRPEGPADFHDHNRAWLKISDGCNQRCSFCVLPAVRGRLVNRSPGEIIEEVKTLLEQGFNEVVLTGVNIGHYRWRESEPRIGNLAGLCRIILDQTNLAKLRISSIEPQTVTDELLEVYRQFRGRLCRHFHIPMQSGSPRILRIMRRPYDQMRYLRRLESVKDAVPEAIIGADVIVGFPGETFEDFAETREICESGLIDYLHVFSYSDRPGTHAAALPEKVGPDVIKARNAILTELSKELRAQANGRQVGRTLDVIAEGHQTDGGFYWGVADNYIKVKLPRDFPGGRQVIKVAIKSACEKYVEGVVS
ncbi:MAG: tRNA (N(6)-L-threonylcarbamoyladenosine(37)-C(2))-methylthiotransferase MtaB [Candidatus Zixiibacteriota bacterium]|nr:MAG: tRNA (N(6)-L-threonylcarbamoyladenosine(37)-C(2))-methylthiotransferase MtaB [candidate division Zixibacteria bacterium]